MTGRVGQHVPLGDTGLSVRVDADDTLPGQELSVGFGRTGRDGIGLRAARAADTCDTVITNVLMIDPVAGVRVCSIGIRAGRIAAIGRAGNPDTMDGVGVVIGTGTTIVPGEGLIATAGGIDTHVHMLSPRVCEAALASGVTTIIGQEFGPVWGVGMNAGPLLATGLAAMDAYPLNVGILGRGSSSDSGPLYEALDGGVCGFKVHEDLGAHRRSLDTALTIADDEDVQVALHTDGLNECLDVVDTLAVIAGRTVHAFHVEGCGGGHTPNVLDLAGVQNIIASSTNPTLPFGRDALAEHVDMICASHGLDATDQGDLRLVRERLRAETMGAEDVLHDLGVIPITSSDAQGMGRAGETFRRTFALAAAGLARSGRPGDRPVDEEHADNDRVLRYLAKLTINPAIAHGLSHDVGLLAVGLRADIVLWEPEFFAAKPTLILKSGFPAWGVTGDPNASVDVAEPRVIGPQYGGIGAAPGELAAWYVSARGLANAPRAGSRQRVAVSDTRTIGLSDMIRHGRLGQVRVAPTTGFVTLDGQPIHADPVEHVALSRLYFL